MYFFIVYFYFSKNINFIETSQKRIHLYIQFLETIFPQNKSSTKRMAIHRRNERIVIARTGRHIVVDGADVS